jgi:hypothetical protein
MKLVRGSRKPWPGFPEFIKAFSKRRISKKPHPGYFEEEPHEAEI